MRPRTAAAAGAVLLAVTLSACKPDPPARNVPPDTSASSAPASPSPSRAPTYQATGFDVCAQADRGPLAGLGLTVDRTTPRQPATGPGASCLFDLHTADGHPAMLLVDAITPSTVEQARDVYASARRITAMTFDGDIAGVGDEADGFTANAQLDFKNAKYLAQGRIGNLVVEVGLSVGGDTFAPKETLATPAVAMVKSTLAKVPTA
jgi:hypothetical protein